MKVVLVGDPNERGGKVIGPGSGTSTIDNRAISLVGDLVSDHPGPDGKIHTGAKTQPLGGGPDITCDNKKITLVNSVDTCGCRRLIGSSDVGFG